MPDTKTLHRNSALYQAHLEDIRTGVLPRLWQSLVYRWTGYPYAAAAEMQMAWERLTNSGDYAPGGHFDKIYPGWRDFDTSCDMFHSADTGHGRIRSPQAAPIDQDIPHDDRRHQYPERITDDDSGAHSDGKPRPMVVPPFLAGE